MIDIPKTTQRLQDHLEALTRTIGERSVLLPKNIEKTKNYIEKFYRSIGMPAHCEPYEYRNFTVSNIVAEISFCDNPTKRYIVGAHYDSVVGTVDADDNASAVAVQLEPARQLNMLKDHQELDMAVKFVSFPLEEPPTYGTRHMGSRVYAMKAWFCFSAPISRKRLEPDSGLKIPRHYPINYKMICAESAFLNFPV